MLDSHAERGRASAAAPQDLGTGEPDQEKAAFCQADFRPRRSTPVRRVAAAARRAADQKRAAASRTTSRRSRSKKARRMRKEEEVEEEEEEEEEEGQAKENGGAQKAYATGKTPVGRVLASPNGQLDADLRNQRNKPSVTPSDSTEHAADVYGLILQESPRLEKAAADWLDAYRSDHAGPLFQLVNIIFRCAGCPESITRETFEKEEVVDIISTVQKLFEQDLNQGYPLISKVKQYKKFRYNLFDFFNKLIKGARGICLEEGVFMDTLQTWVIAMSSSPFRPFRHTATVIGLAVTTALCEVGQAIGKALTVAERQLITEKKNATPRRLRNKERALESKVQELQKEKDKMVGFMKEFFDGIFILRYRDVDPSVRSDCITELAVWMTTFPEYFLSDQLMKYMGWLLSDKNAQVRIAAVKAIGRLVDQWAQVAASNVLRRFFQRFHRRIVDMALRESDSQVRTAALTLCATAGQHGHLLESDAEDLCLLVFHSHPDVRRGVAPFFANILENEVTEAVSAVEACVGDDVDVDEEKVKLKAIVSLLARCGGRSKAQALLKENESIDEEEESEAIDRKAGSLEDETESGSVPCGGRVGKAVEAIWAATPILHNWTLLLNYACEDHSAQAKNNGSQSRGRVGVETNRILDDLYKLSDPEDATLVQVMVACLYNLTTPDAVQGVRAKDKKKVQEAAEKARGEISRALIDLLPKLITKYSPNSARLRDVLSLITIMDLGVYADLRMPRAYKSLVSDVILIFGKHSNKLVLDSAVHCFAAFCRAPEYGELVRDRLTELVEDLTAKIAEYNKGSDLATMDFNEDERDELYATLVKLERFSAVLNPLSGFSDGQNETVATSALERVAGRGKLGYLEDAPLVLSAIRSLYQLLLWHSFALKLATEGDRQSDSEAVGQFVEFRRRIIVLAEELCLGATHAPEAVKISAFNILVDIYLLASAGWVNELGDAAGSKLQLAVPDGKQERYATFVSATIEQYAHNVTARNERSSKAEDDEDGCSRQGQALQRKRKQKRNGKGKGKQVDMARQTHGGNPATVGDQQLLRNLHDVKRASGGMVKLVRHAAFHVKHSSLILAWYGRVDPAFDEICKKLADVVGDVWSSDDREEVLSEVANACLESLEEAFERHLVEGTAIADHTLALAKLLAHALQFGTSAAHSKTMVQFHESGAEHALAKAAGYRRINAQSAMNRALKFFRALVPFVVLLAKGYAPHVAEAVEKLVEENKLRPEGKDWDPYMTYLKQLRAGRAPTRIARGPATAVPVREVDPASKANGRSTRPAPRGYGGKQRSGRSYCSAEEEEVDEVLLIRKTNQSTRTDARTGAAGSRRNEDLQLRCRLDVSDSVAAVVADEPTTTHASDFGDSQHETEDMSDNDREDSVIEDEPDEDEQGSPRKRSAEGSDAPSAIGQGEHRSTDDNDDEPADSLPDRRKRMRR